MTDHNPTKLNLVNSSRLQALRNTGATGQEKIAAKIFEKSPDEEPEQNAETTRLKQQIDLRLREILADLPTGKQHSLFKIRFGVGLEELNNLPIKRVAEILKITPARAKLLTSRVTR